MRSDEYEALLKDLMIQLQSALELKSASKAIKATQAAFMETARKVREIDVNTQRTWPIYGS